MRNKTKLVPEPPEIGGMVKSCTYIDRPTRDALQEYSRHTGVPQSEVIRRAVRAYLMAQKKGII